MATNPYVLLTITLIVCVGVLLGVSAATGEGPLTNTQKDSVTAQVAAQQPSQPLQQPQPQGYAGGCGV